MLIIQGPHPSLTSIVILPSPTETNTESLAATVQTIRMMDGSLRTYVKPKDSRKRFRWTFVVAHTKAKELEDYTIAYSGEPAMVSWKNTNYIGWLTLNPFEMRGQTQEYYEITLEFEEKK